MRLALFGLSLIAALSLAAPALACTGISLIANDGGAVNGRTVEFGTPLNISLVVIPRNHAFKGTLPDGSEGLSYRSHYAVVGGGTFGEPAIVDGLNEKGLAVAAFYFPNYAEYASVNPENNKRGLSPTQFPNWLLTQFATIEEVKNHLNQVSIMPTQPKGWPLVPPFHYVVYDKSGKSVVIEPIKGKLVCYDNPLGVMSNSPGFDWHMTNLSNYINLSPMNAAPVNMNGLKLKQFGQGSGLHGLPGDFTPPSRLVRAALFTAAAPASTTADQAVYQLFHLLNQFDIPMGAVKAEMHGTTIYDTTLLTTVKDTQNIKYYYRSYQDQSIKMVDLSQFDLDDSKIKSFRVEGQQQVIDVSKMFN